jgi:hypothetical protein
MVPYALFFTLNSAFGASATGAAGAVSCANAVLAASTARMVVNLLIIKFLFLQGYVFGAANEIH